MAIDETFTLTVDLVNITGEDVPGILVTIDPVDNRLVYPVSGTTLYPQRITGRTDDTGTVEFDLLPTNKPGSDPAEPLAGEYVVRIGSYSRKITMPASDSVLSNLPDEQPAQPADDPFAFADLRNVDPSDIVDQTARDAAAAAAAAAGTSGATKFSELTGKIAEAQIPDYSISDSKLAKQKAHEIMKYDGAGNANAGLLTNVNIGADQIDKDKFTTGVRESLAKADAALARADAIMGVDALPTVLPKVDTVLVLRDPIDGNDEGLYVVKEDTASYYEGPVEPSIDSVIALQCTLDHNPNGSVSEIEWTVNGLHLYMEFDAGAFTGDPPANLYLEATHSASDGATLNSTNALSDLDKTNSQVTLARQAAYDRRGHYSYGQQLQNEAFLFWGAQDDGYRIRFNIYTDSGFSTPLVAAGEKYYDLITDNKFPRQMDLVRLAQGGAADGETLIWNETDQAWEPSNFLGGTIDNLLRVTKDIHIIKDWSKWVEADDTYGDLAQFQLTSFDAVPPSEVTLTDADFDNKGSDITIGSDAHTDTSVYIRVTLENAKTKQNMRVVAEGEGITGGNGWIEVTGPTPETYKYYYVSTAGNNKGDRYHLQRFDDDVFHTEFQGDLAFKAAQRLLPKGGTTGQLPVKKSATDGDVEWKDSASGTDQTARAAAAAAQATADAALPTSGGTMSGPLQLVGSNPASDDEAASKKYVDDNAGAAAGIKVDRVVVYYAAATINFVLGRLDQLNQIGWWVKKDDESTLVTVKLLNYFRVSDTQIEIWLEPERLPSLSLGEIVELWWSDTDPTDTTYRFLRLFESSKEDDLADLSGSGEWYLASNVPAAGEVVSERLRRIDRGKLPLAGGTLTGALTLSGAPTADLQAATKKYVDDNASSGGMGNGTDGEDGEDGEDGAQGAFYFRTYLAADTEPSKPTAGTYDVDNDTFSITPSTWKIQVPTTTGNQRIWAIESPIDPANDAGTTVDLTAGDRWGAIFPITGAVGPKGEAGGPAGALGLDPVGNALTVNGTAVAGPDLDDLNDVLELRMIYTRVNTNLYMWSRLLKSDISAAGMRLQLQGASGAYMTVSQANDAIRLSNAGFAGSVSSMSVQFFNVNGGVGGEGEALAIQDDFPPVDDKEEGEIIAVDDGLYALGVTDDTTPNLYEGTVGRSAITLGNERWRGISNDQSPNGFSTDGGWTANPDNAISLLMASNDAHIRFAVKHSVYETAKGSDFATTDKVAIKITFSDGDTDEAVCAYYNSYTRNVNYLEFQHQHATDNYNLYSEASGNAISAEFFTVGTDGNATTTPFLTHAVSTKHWLPWPPGGPDNNSPAYNLALANAARLDALDAAVDGGAMPIHDITYDHTTALLAPPLGDDGDFAVSTTYNDILATDLIVIDWTKAEHLNHHSEHVLPGSGSDAGRMYVTVSNFDNVEYDGEFIYALEHAIQDNGSPDTLNSWIVGSIVWDSPNLTFGLHLQQGGSRANRNLTARPGFSVRMRVFRNTTPAAATSDNLHARVLGLTKQLGGLSVVTLTEAEYTALTAKDDKTLYITTAT